MHRFLLKQLPGSCLEDGNMELIHELGGHSVGSGMLSQENAALRGLKAIKLKEEDPLVIGYIKRKGSNPSTYGQLYIEELLKCELPTAS